MQSRIKLTCITLVTK